MKTSIDINTQDSGGSPYFNLVAKAVGECFLPIKRKKIKTKTGLVDESIDDYYKRKLKIKKRRIEFTKSKLFKIWCDCTDNFEYNKLRKLIINKNK